MESCRLSLVDRLGEGAYADVFARPGGQVAKLFRRKPLDPDGRAVRAMFAAETSAFAIGHSNPGLSRSLAAFYGPVSVSGVDASSGPPVDGSYWLDCCYAIERLRGEERKVFALPSLSLPSVETLLDRLSAAGVGYGADASAFGWQNVTSMKLIDVATYDVAATFHALLFDANDDLVDVRVPG